jgi:hypothetical protein
VLTLNPNRAANFCWVMASFLRLLDRAGAATVANRGYRSQSYMSSSEKHRALASMSVPAPHPVRP